MKLHVNTKIFAVYGEATAFTLHLAQRAGG